MRPGVYSWPDTFLIAYFEGTVDLRSSLAAVHLRALWALPPAVKPPAFKRDPAFIQIWRLFEEVRYMYLLYSICIPRLSHKLKVCRETFSRLIWKQLLYTYLSAIYFHSNKNQTTVLSQLQNNASRLHVCIYTCTCSYTIVMTSL